MAGLLTRTALDEIIGAAVEAGLADPKLRSVLLGDLPPTLVAQLTAYGKPRAQIESDLGVLNRTPALDGRLPLHTWLDAAARLTEPLPAAAVFRRHRRGEVARAGTNLPPPNGFFVGRDALLVELHRRLTGGGAAVALNQPVSAAGHGGVGKTELAVAYGWRHLGDWPGGVWVVRADGAGPARHLAGLAVEVLGAARSDALRDEAARAEAVVAALAGGLLIVDNLDEVRWFAPWRAVAARVRLLVTTRRARLPGLPEDAALRVDRLTTAEGVALLARHRADAGAAENAEAVEGVVEALDGFAVALAAVGVYARHARGFAWGRYRDALLARPLATLDEGEGWAEGETGEGARYRRRASAVFDDTLALLAEREPAARVALGYAGWLPAEGFPLHWLGWLLREDGVELAAGPGVDGAAAAGEALLDDGLLRRVDGDRVALHAVLRAVVRRVDAGEAGARLDAVYLLGWARGTVCKEAVMQPALRPELAPLLALAEGLRHAGRLGAAARVVNRIDAPLSELGRYTERHDALAPLAGPDGHRLGADDDGLGAAVLNNLGLALMDLGQAKAARDRLSQAVALYERRVGPDHPTLAISHSNLATALRDLGELAEARRRAEQAIAIEERHFAPDHPSLAVGYTVFALILQDLGELAEARRRFEQAIAIWEHHFEPDHPTLAVGYSNLAGILRALGELPEARRRVEQAIAINEHHFAPDHPALAVSYSNLALILRDLGELAEARRCAEQALAINERHFAPDHLTLAVGYSSLALILQDLGELAEARRRVEQAIAIEERHFEPDHPKLAVRYNNLARIALAQGRRDEARALWRRAVEICERRLPAGHPHTRVIRGALAKLGPEEG